MYKVENDCGRHFLGLHTHINMHAYTHAHPPPHICKSFCYGVCIIHKRHEARVAQLYPFVHNTLYSLSAFSSFLGLVSLKSEQEKSYLFIVVLKEAI